MAKVSVIIPLYNKGKYIARTLRSVLQQQWTDFEVLVIDDGSTDNGASIVKSFNNKRVRLIRQTNKGPGSARNRGVRESHSPYLTFLDADDEWSADFLQRALYVLGAHKIFVSNFYPGEGNYTYTEHFPDFEIKYGPTALPTDTEPEKVKRYIDFFTQGNVVLDRNIVEKLGGYYEDGCTYGEDSYLWLKVLLNYPFFVCPKPLMRLHFDSSELGYGRKEYYPIHPLVRRHEEILQSCPEKYSILAKRVLDFYALINIWRCLDRCDYVSASELTNAFPYSKQYIFQFKKAKIKVKIKYILQKLGFPKSARA